MRYLPIIVFLFMSEAATAQSFEKAFPKIIKDCSNWISTGKIKSLKSHWMLAYNGKHKSEYGKGRTYFFAHPNLPITLEVEEFIYKKNLQLRSPDWTNRNCRVVESDPSRGYLVRRLRRYNLNGAWKDVKPLKNGVAENTMLAWYKNAIIHNRLPDYTNPEALTAHGRNTRLLDCFTSTPNIIDLYIDGVLERPIRNLPVWQVSVNGPHYKEKIPCAGS